MIIADELHLMQLSRREVQCAATRLPAGLGVAVLISVADNPDRERGAQEEKPGDREVKRALANVKDGSRREEGRDVPPEQTVVDGKRTRESPWLGGG